MFLEVTSRSGSSKDLINVSHIVAIRTVTFSDEAKRRFPEREASWTEIETLGDASLTCRETYDEIVALLDSPKKDYVLRVPEKKKTGCGANF